MVQYLLDIQYTHCTQDFLDIHYCDPKKSCTFVYCEHALKIWQDFLDVQYFFGASRIGCNSGSRCSTQFFHLASRVKQLRIICISLRENFCMLRFSNFCHIFLVNKFDWSLNDWSYQQVAFQDFPLIRIIKPPNDIGWNFLELIIFYNVIKYHQNHSVVWLLLGVKNPLAWNLWRYDPTQRYFDE